MSRLVNFGPGDICDRLTVLALKVLFGRTAGRNVDHFENEQAVLLSKITSRTLNGSWFVAALDLAAVNAALWHAEDDLRAMRDTVLGCNSQDAGRLAFRIQALNDHRAALIEQINKETGDHLGPEKHREEPS